MLHINMSTEGLDDDQVEAHLRNIADSFHAGICSAYIYDQGEKIGSWHMTMRHTTSEVQE